MKIVAYRNVYDCDIEFQDEYNYIFKHAIYNNFIQGKIKNPYDKTVFGIGMLGDGEYKARKDANGMTKIYECWRTILARCYAYKEKYPAYYKITTVCDEWLNFQSFAKWYEDNQYKLPNNERLHIDKDILIPCNTVYSPENCILVPQKINMLFVNSPNKRNLPTGIYKCKNKFLAKYNTEDLGVYDTIEKAYLVYANKKEEHIRELADKYNKFIPRKLYGALYKYKVCIENDKNYKQ